MPGRGSDHRYPLEAARTVRSVARDAAADRLAEAVAARAQAATRCEDAVRALAAFRRAEHERLVRESARQGETCSAAALQQEERYRARRRHEEGALSVLVSRAQAEERAAGRSVDRARRGLADADGEASALEHHHEHWQRAERRAAERAADDEIDDLCASRRGR